MENNTEVSEIKYKNMFVSICVIQGICIAVILITLLIIKFFFEGSYQKISIWSDKNILEQTKITADFNEENDT